MRGFRGGTRQTKKGKASRTNEGKRTRGGGEPKPFRMRAWIECEALPSHCGRPPLSRDLADQGACQAAVINARADERRREGRERFGPPAPPALGVTRPRWYCHPGLERHGTPLTLHMRARRGHALADGTSWNVSWNVYVPPPCPSILTTSESQSQQLNHSSHT